MGDLGRKARVLEVSGERADESRARARKAPFEYNRAASNKTRRDVWTWRIALQNRMGDGRGNSEMFRGARAAPPAASVL